MMKRKSCACLIIALIAMTIGLCGVFAASAEEPVASPEFSLERGAGVRIADDGHNGLRFTLKMAKSDYDALKSNGNYTDVSFGVLIAPEDYLTDGHGLTAENVFGDNAIYDWANLVDGEWQYTDNGKVRIINLETDTLSVCEDNANEVYYRAAIVDILEKNIAREFRGVAYMKYTENGATVYRIAADNDNVRSVAYVAQMAVAAGDGNAQLLKASYIDKVANVDTTYTVKHFKDHKDGKPVLADTQMLTAKINAAVTPSAISVAGYVYSGKEVSGTVLANGKLTLEMHYEIDFSAENLNLASKEVAGYWSFDDDYGTLSYNETEAALEMDANGNSWTYTLYNGAVFAASDAGFNALTFKVKGGNGRVGVFVSNNWAADAGYEFGVSEDYSEHTVYFGDLDLTDKSGITVLASGASGTASVLVKDMKFVTIDPADLIDYTDKNLADEEYTGKWACPSGIPALTYDATEAAVKFTHNGNTDVYNFTESALMKAKAAGKTGLKVTAKGIARVALFVGSSWGTDAQYTPKSNDEYETFYLWFGQLEFTKNSGIGVLCAANDIYIKEMIFTDADPADFTTDYTVKNLASEELMSDWQYPSAQCEAPSYDATETAIKFTHSGNTGVYKFTNGAIAQANEAGKTGLKITSKGTARVAIFLDGNEWGTDIQYAASSADGYETYYLWFGTAAVTSDSGIGVLCNANDIYIKEIIFVTAEDIPEDEKIVYENLASEKYLNKWIARDEKASVVYDEAASAMKFSFTGKSTVRFDFDGLLKLAKKHGKTKLTFTVSDGNGTDFRIRTYLTQDAWNSMSGSQNTLNANRGQSENLKTTDAAAVLSVDCINAVTADCYITGIIFE